MYLFNIHTHKIESGTESGYGVRCILNTYPEDFKEKKQAHPGAWLSCGIHPWFSGEPELQFDLLRTVASDPQVVALGETGLDKQKGPGLAVQTSVFRKQIELAIEVKKPLIVHCVGAWDELIALYREYDGSVPWVIHGYRGNPEQTRHLSRIGFRFSLGESFNKESLRHIPLDSIFCETDVSGLTICQVYENISKDIGLNLNQFAIFVEENVKNTFQ
jgi:TatD DNase family protein